MKVGLFLRSRATFCKSLASDALAGTEVVESSHQLLRRRTLFLLCPARGLSADTWWEGLWEQVSAVTVTASPSGLLACCEWPWGSVLECSPLQLPRPLRPGGFSR